MKNKFYTVFFILNIIFSNISFADPFEFKTTDIKIKDEGNLIYASEGTAISDDKNLVIEAKNFEYNQELDFLKAFNGTAFIKPDNLEIQFDEVEIDSGDYVKKKQLISKKLIENEEEKDTKIFVEKQKSILIDKKNNTGSKFFSYLVVFIISFVALIILLDTLKTPIINVFPGFEIILSSLFETLHDIKLFIIDLY